MSINCNNKVSMIVWNEFLNDARVLKEAQTLMNAGFSVKVHALHTPGKTLEREKLEKDIEVIRVCRSPLWKLRNKNSQTKTAFKQSYKKVSNNRQFLKLLARVWTHVALCYKLVQSKADVIHAHDVNVLLTAWIASKILRAPLIYDAHEISTSREGYKEFRKLVGILEKKIVPKVSGFITTTDMRAKYFSRAYKVSKPLVLQNRPRLSKTSDKSRFLRDSLELIEDWPIVLYQGGIQSGRGLDKLVRAAALVENCYFVFIGGGRQLDELQRLVYDLDLAERVKFIPTVPLSELPTYTASADIGIQPIENTCLNHYTTDSNKLFEYVQSGIPVLATGFPEIRKIVSKYNIGELLDGVSVESISNGINMMLNDRESLNLYRSNALRYRSELSWEEQECKLVELYKDVMT